MSTSTDAEKAAAEVKAAAPVAFMSAAAVRAVVRYLADIFGDVGVVTSAVERWVVSRYNRVAGCDRKLIDEVAGRVLVLEDEERTMIEDIDALLAKHADDASDRVRCAPGSVQCGLLRSILIVAPHAFPHDASPVVPVALSAHAGWGGVG